METIEFGRTGRHVSRLGFGGATAGIKNYLRRFDASNPDDRERIISAIHRALELGINYFDTAPGYGDGASELIFGEALEQVTPHEIFLATKYGIWSGKPVREELELSLTRLRRSSVDLYQVHGTAYNEDHAQRLFSRGGIVDQLVALRDEGLIRHIGFTGECINSVFFRLLECEVMDSVQVLYNFTMQHPYDPAWKSGVLYDAEARELGIVAMRSTTSGVFQKWIQAVNPGNTFDYTPGLIAFQLSNPLIDVALVGMDSPEIVEKNVALATDPAARIDPGQLYQRHQTTEDK